MARSALVEQYSRWLDFDAFQRDGAATTPLPGNLRTITASEVPPNRLLHLLQQAVAFQIGSARQKPPAPPKIGTILEDYESVMIPNNRFLHLQGHGDNVKCVTFIGVDGCAIASGSSDNTVRVWDSRSGQCRAVLSGHRSRVWDVSSTNNGALLASAGGDGTVRLWSMSEFLPSSNIWKSSNMRSTGGVSSHQTSMYSSQFANGSYLSRLPTFDKQFLPVNVGEETEFGSNEDIIARPRPLAILRDHADDVYTVRFHALGNSLATGGYDKKVRLFDVEAGKVIRTLCGHQSPVSCVAFNARGNMIITGSKDSTIKYWDIISGLCVKTISSPLGEVTSVETNKAGTLLISSSKDNSNRLWDMRTSKPVRRFKGHQNTSKNFIRTAFGPRESQIYVWDIETTAILSKLGPARGPVYSARWNARQSLVVSASHDRVATCWYYDPEWSTSSDI